MIREIIKSISHEQWNIGFIENSLSEIMRGVDLNVKWLKHNSQNSWFADPFVLDVNDYEIHLLVEEFCRPINRGRISRLIVDKESYELRRLDVVLELPTHLSFPAIRRKDGDIYIYPENGESGSLNLYHYKPRTNECTLETRILDGAIEDAVIANIDGQEWLFCTEMPNPNGNVLKVYKKKAQGKYIHYTDCSFVENVARMAGDFFEYNGKIYRPTQECNRQYGHAVTLQEVHLESNQFSFEEVQRFHSVHPQLNVGMHTFNMFKDVIVTDALGFRHMWIRNLLKLLGILL